MIDSIADDVSKPDGPSVLVGGAIGVEHMSPEVEVGEIGRVTMKLITLLDGLPSQGEGSRQTTAMVFRRRRAVGRV